MKIKPFRIEKYEIGNFLTVNFEKGNSKRETA